MYGVALSLHCFATGFSSLPLPALTQGSLLKIFKIYIIFSGKIRVEISRYISDKCRIIIRDAIKEAEGNEVFFTGSIDENGLVTEVKIGARGNEHTVTVNFSDSQNLTKASVLIHNHPGETLHLLRLT